MDEDISIIGAREHNLKNVDINIHGNKLVVFTGVSGSGKSTIVFDTIYTESPNVQVRGTQKKCSTSNIKARTSPKGRRKT